MVKLGPDLENGADSYSGYQPNGNFTGFSMLHESGTGGAPKYGVVSQLPVLGNISNPLANLQATRASPDITEVGYYKSSLGSGITVELSATRKGGLYKYTFPKDSVQPNIVVDVSHVLPSYRGQGLGQNYLGGRIDVKEDQPGHVHYEGYGIYDNVSTIRYGLSTLKALTYCRVGTELDRGAYTFVVILTALQRMGRLLATGELAARWLNTATKLHTSHHKLASGLSFLLKKTQFTQGWEFPSSLPVRRVATSMNRSPKAHQSIPFEGTHELHGMQKCYQKSPLLIQTRQ
jgi:hypothetical protein